jgi:putative transcriptional regulator
MAGATEQSVSLWERTGKVPRGADAIVRMIVLEKLNGDGKVTQIIDRINTVERLVNQQIVCSRPRSPMDHQRAGGATRTRTRIAWLASR